MKRWFVGLAIVSLTAGFASSSQAKTNQAYVNAVNGEVVYSYNLGTWQKLSQGDLIDQGAVIKTGLNSTAELVLDNRAQFLQVQADSVLRLETLTQKQTLLELEKGKILGKQQAAGNDFQIRFTNESAALPGSVVPVGGTEYKLSAFGSVEVFNGEVCVHIFLNKGQQYWDLWNNTVEVGSGEVFRMPNRFLGAEFFNDDTTFQNKYVHTVDNTNADTYDDSLGFGTVWYSDLAKVDLELNLEARTFRDDRGRLVKKVKRNPEVSPIGHPVDKQSYSPSTIW